VKTDSTITASQLRSHRTVSRLPGIAILLFLLHLSFFGANAQKKQLQFDHIGTATGISENNVLCILQDRQGFMWFGTSSGLIRYDGYTCTVYKNDKKNPRSISANFIQSIAESKNGDLWIGTSGGGLCRYDRRKDKFTRFKNDTTTQNSIVDGDINFVLEDSQEQVWIGTPGGLDRFDPNANLFTHYTYNKSDSSCLSDSYITSIFEDSNNDVWVATLKGGLNLFNRNTGTFTRFLHSKNNDRSVSSNSIHTIFEDSKKRLWIGTTENGLDLFDRNTGRFYNFKNDPASNSSLASNAVRAIKESNQHELWIGTENGGISIFNTDKKVFQAYQNDEFDNASLASNSVNTICKDTRGNMWIGMFNAGVDMANMDAGKFSSYRHIPSRNSLSNNKVLCIYEDSRKKIWIGTDGGGLNLLDPQTGHFTHFLHDKNNKNSICANYVLSVCEDSKGNIWVGTWGEGITVFDRAGRSFKHFKNDPYDPTSLSSNNAWKIIEDKDKNIWIGTYGGGLNKFNASTNSFTSYQYDEKNTGGIPDNWINSIYEDVDGNLWISTSGAGLNLFDRKKGTCTPFRSQQAANNINNNGVGGVYVDENKNLWIASRTGLHFMDRKTHKFTLFTADDGLPSDVIFGILADEKKNLWLSTDNGISCFNTVTRTCKNFNAEAGLQSGRFNEFAYCKSSTGVMYFGGNSGLNQFSPDSVKTILFDPPLVMTSFQVFNKDIPVALNESDPSPLKETISGVKSIVLPYKSSVFSFAFASLNYSPAARKEYAYILEGFDKTWHEVGMKHTATYTNLDPGTYIFKVKGLNSEGAWSSTITTIELTITPPFWLTWWFKIGVTLLVAGIIAAFFFARMRVAKRQRQLLEQKVEEQTIQLKHSNEEERKARLEADQANIELGEKNKELEQFVYIASHDLREPLRTTSSFIDLFQKKYKGKLDEKADTYLSYITGATERMTMLINDLLDYSKIGNKEFAPVDCNAILENVLQDLGRAIKEQSATISTDSLPVIHGHQMGIKQLFQNLIANGIKFRKKDIPSQIRISAVEEDAAWKFSFADNGIGIDKQYAEKIFVIFQRLHSRKEYEGTGIGLAHCKKIVESHKGKIWMDSVPGEGSTFYFTIAKP
jgi:ligand-binding sensor domain-containing protein/signal transduction histidine kinase